MILMFIKNLSHKRPSFRNAINYVCSDHVKGDKADFELFHNLMYDDREGIIEQFEDNNQYKKVRKGGSGYVHDVISFSPNSTISQLHIEELVKEYIKQRYSDCMVFAKAHQDSPEKHFHVHMIVSRNFVGSSKCFHQNNREFLLTKKRLEAVQIIRYGDDKSISYLSSEELRKVRQHALTDRYVEDLSSLDGCFTDKKRNAVKSRQNQSLEKLRQARNKEGFSGVLNNELQNSVASCYDDAISIVDFTNKLRSLGIESYSRGKINLYGVVFNNRKYRLSKLIGKGYLLELEKREQRKKEIDQINRDLRSRDDDFIK